MNATAVVTGAAGFIGSHLVDHLVAAGRRVVGIDNFDSYYSVGVKRRNIAGALASGGFELIEGDVAEPAVMRAALEVAGPGCTVFHLAAKAGVRPSIADPTGYMRANVLGTASVLDASRACGAARVVFASSSSVYGNASRVPFSEDDPAVSPISPYAASKRACELLAHSHHHLTRTPVACLRFFTVFGPRQRPDLAISQFLASVAAGRAITMFGDGSTSRDYTYVDDVIAGVLAAERRIDAHGFRVWNLGNSRPTSLRDLIAAIGRTVGRDPVVKAGPMQAGDVERTWADTARSGLELGYAPSTGLGEGLVAQWRGMAAEGA